MEKRNTAGSFSFGVYGPGLARFAQVISVAIVEVWSFLSRTNVSRQCNSVLCYLLKLLGDVLVFVTKKDTSMSMRWICADKGLFFGTFQPQHAARTCRRSHLDLLFLSTR